MYISDVLLSNSVKPTCAALSDLIAHVISVRQKKPNIYIMTC